LADAFGGFDLIHQDPSNVTGSIGALASLNAFTPEVLERVLAAATALQVPPSEVVCLTGAVREIGLEEAKRLGFSVVAVGHRRCELWGLKHFHQLLEQSFPKLEVLRVDEPEEPVIKVPKVAKVKHADEAMSSKA
jgi:hypothetical protein